MSEKHRDMDHVCPNGQCYGYVPFAKDHNCPVSTYDMRGVQETPKCNCEPYLRESCEVCRPKRDGLDYPPEAPTNEEYAEMVRKAPVSAREWKIWNENTVYRQRQAVAGVDCPEGVHVIEYSAYESALTKRDEWYKLCIEKDKYAAKLIQERDEQAEKSAALIEALKEIICNGPISVEEHSDRAQRVAIDAITKWGSK